MATAGLALGARIVDIGGGTGAHAEVMRGDGHRPTVVDPSSAQRARASRRALPVVGAAAQALPFAEDSFDLAYFHLSLHYGDWRAALAEAVRVVRSGGRLWVWTFTRKYLETSFTGAWFPSVRVHDVQRFPGVDDIVGHLRAIKVGEVETHTVVDAVDRSVAGWEEAFRARFVSTLQLIDDAELDEGIARFRAAHPDPVEQVVADLEFLAISGSVGR